MYLSLTSRATIQLMIGRKKGFFLGGGDGRLSMCKMWLMFFSLSLAEFDFSHNLNIIKDKQTFKIVQQHHQLT